jgi:hypothetical protein
MTGSMIQHIVTGNRCQLCWSLTARSADFPQFPLPSINNNALLKMSELGSMKSIFKVKSNECEVVLLRNNSLDKHTKRWHSTLYNKELPCKKCSFIATTGHKLKRHLNDPHQQVDRYQRKPCPTKWKAAAYYRCQVNSVHFNANKWKCELCEYATSRGSHFERHMKEIHHRSGGGNIGTFTDKLIKNGRKKEEKGVLHSTIASSENNFCLATHRETKNKGDIQERELSKSKLFIRIEEKVESWLNESSEKAVSTEDLKCVFLSEDARDLKTHNCNVHHKTNSKGLEDIGTAIDGNVKDKKCLHCKFSACNALDLMQHVIEVHFKKKEMTCLHCKFTTHFVVNLSRHVNAVHQNIEDNECHLCNNAGKTGRNMNRPFL